MSRRTMERKIDREQNKATKDNTSAQIQRQIMRDCPFKAFSLDSLQVCGFDELMRTLSMRRICLVDNFFRYRAAQTTRWGGVIGIFSTKWERSHSNNNAKLKKLTRRGRERERGELRWRKICLFLSFTLDPSQKYENLILINMSMRTKMGIRHGHKRKNNYHFSDTVSIDSYLARKGTKTIFNIQLPNKERKKEREKQEREKEKENSTSTEKIYF